MGGLDEGDEKEYESLKSEINAQLDEFRLMEKCGYYFNDWNGNSFVNQRKMWESNKELESKVSDLNNQILEQYKTQKDHIIQIAKLEEELKLETYRKLLAQDKAVHDSQQLEQYKKALDEIKVRYEYLRDFKGIRKEWHERVVEELKAIIDKI